MFVTRLLNICKNAVGLGKLKGLAVLGKNTDV
jgi:hypothetical protein